MRGSLTGGASFGGAEAARVLGQVEIITCAAPAYLLRHGTPQHPDDFHGSHHVVGVLPRPGGRAVPLRFGSGAAMVDVVADDFLVVSEGEPHLAAALAGLGVIQGLDYVVKPYLASGELMPILQSWGPAPYRYEMVYTTSHRLSRRLALFMDWLEEVFKELVQ